MYQLNPAVNYWTGFYYFSQSRQFESFLRRWNPSQKEIYLQAMYCSVKAKCKGDSVIDLAGFFKVFQNL